MQLDGFTLIAQIVNFLVLVYLLKRFLYRPVLDAMDQREANINARLQQATAREQSASKTINTYQSKLQELQQQREQAMAGLNNDIKNERAKQLEAARLSIEQTRQGWQRELKQQQQQFLQNLRQQLNRDVCQLSRQVISDLADVELEEQLVSVLLRRLQSLQPEQQQALLKSCSGDNAAAIVISALPLSENQQQQIRDQIQQLIKRDITIHFRQQTDLICGIRLETPQQTLDWNVSDYFEQLQQRLIANVPG